METVDVGDRVPGGQSDEADTLGADAVMMTSFQGVVSSDTLMPKGLSVRSFVLRIPPQTQSLSRPPEPTTPAAPALETAAASHASEIQVIAPWRIGYLMPSFSFNDDFMLLSLLYMYLRCLRHGTAPSLGRFADRYMGKMPRARAICADMLSPPFGEPVILGLLLLRIGRWQYITAPEIIPFRVG